MAQSAWAGRRCLAVRDIITAQGCIPEHANGTLCRVICYDENFRAIVAWDQAFTVAVSPYDIMIFPADEGSQALPHVDQEEARVCESS